MSRVVEKFITDSAITANKLASGAVTDAKVSTGIDASKIANGTVSNTEFQYLNSVTSDIQTQLNGKEPTITTLAINKGGTGQTTQTDAFDALAPTTTKGDLVAHNGSDNVRLAAGTNGTFLKADSSASAGVTWASTVETYAVRSITSTDTLSASTDDVALLSGASFTLNLPTAVGNTGKRFVIKHVGTSLTQNYTIDGNGSQTIDGTTTYVLYTNGESVTIVSDGANWILLDHKTETGWTDTGAISITATTTNPTKGTTARDKLFWKREGANARLRFEYRHTAAGTAGSGVYLLALPSNITIDTSIVSTSTDITSNGADSNQAISYLDGNGFMTNDSARGLLTGRAYNSSTLVFMAPQYFTAANLFGSAAYPFSQTVVAFSFECVVPVSGWRE